MGSRLFGKSRKAERRNDGGELKRFREEMLEPEGATKRKAVGKENEQNGTER